MISKDEVAKLTKNTRQFYKACCAHGFFLPPLKNQFCSQKLLMEVFSGTCFCPMLKDVKFLPCLHPPPADQLLELIAAMIEGNESYASEEQARQYKRLAAHMRRSKPDK